jgi:crotonobetainyl-CoA:carnitine CoA-transferase CaiB-like acyl-CoA transferase
MIDQQAFTGVRVIDFSQGIAGPHGAMLLAQHGADVIKIEPVGGDWGRVLGRPFGEHTAHSIAFNRGKRSIAVDLTKPSGVEICRRAIKTCDVIIEAFRPGVMAKYGLSYDDARKMNDKVIYLSVNGFGSVGPKRNLPVTDAVIQASSGLMTVNRSSDGTPNRLAMTPIDVVTGLYAFQALATALVRKFRFGTGAQLEISLMQAAAAFQAAKIMEFELDKGEVEPLYSPVATLKTTDGYINITAMREAHFEALCNAIGRPDLATDTRYQGRENRIRHEQTLLPVLREEFAKQSSAHWVSTLNEAGVMNAVVQDYRDFLNDAQTRACSAVSCHQHPGVGAIVVAEIPGALRSSEGVNRFVAPRIGEHTDQILAELNYSLTEIEGMRGEQSIIRVA